MPTVELVYDHDCPNIIQARENLLRAFTQTGLAPQWREWDRADPQAPDYVRAFGSPAVLVNSKDVAGTPPNDAACCRVYAGGAGAPPVDMIAAALSPTRGARTTRQGAAAILPAVGGALLPKLTCPVCWPAYTALLSALGLDFIDYTPYLLPLTATLLVVALVPIFRASRARGSYLPAGLGAVGAVLMLTAKFYADSDALNYTGIALLVVAFLWNAWPRKAGSASCPACVTHTDLHPHDPIHVSRRTKRSAVGFLKGGAS